MQRHSRSTCLLIAVLAVAAGSSAVAGDTAVAQPMVDTYDSLADTILGAKQTEWNLVHSILAATYAHAEGTYRSALATLDAGGDPRGAIEDLAELVGQLGNEGDAAVAAIRKRLIEGGHHHHADDGDDGEYDTGFVIVTREARKALLDAAKRIGKLAADPDRAALEREWKTVQARFESLHAGG